jgi:hypothetical protein
MGSNTKRLGRPDLAGPPRPELVRLVAGKAFLERITYVALHKWKKLVGIEAFCYILH